MVTAVRLAATMTATAATAMPAAAACWPSGECRNHSMRLVTQSSANPNKPANPIDPTGPGEPAGLAGLEDLDDLEAAARYPAVAEPRMSGATLLRSDTFTSPSSASTSRQSAHWFRCAADSAVSCAARPRA
jgi:hypothetical protein